VLVAVFACAAKLDCGVYDARHTRAGPPIMQWVLNVTETVIIKLSRITTVAQSLSTFLPLSFP